MSDPSPRHLPTVRFPFQNISMNELIRQLPFESRDVAGRMLAGYLQIGRPQEDPLVMAVQRGGIPVALEVARALDAELDLIMVRKLGVPGQAGLTMGAVASGGIGLRNLPLIREAEIGDAEYRRIRMLEMVELQQRELFYRSSRPAPRMEGRSVILVDDGVCSGITMRTAIRSARRLDPWEIVVCVPVASAQGLEAVTQDADKVICLAVPDPFLSVGLCYRDFPAVCDDEVRTTLQDGWRNGRPGRQEAIREVAVESG